MLAQKIEPGPDGGSAQPLLVALFTLLVGCAQHGDVSLLPPFPSGDTASASGGIAPNSSAVGPATETGQIRSYIDAVASSEEREALAALLEASETIWSAPEFIKNLSSLGARYSSVYVTSGVKRDAKTLVDLLAGAAGERRVAAAVTLVGDRNEFFALTGATGDGKTASMALGRGNLYVNWLANDEVHRSCGINTMVHEMSHLIFAAGRPVESSSQLIQDSGAAAESATGDAVASYLIGTVAQCTWLQKRMRVSSEGLQDCIAVFGHRGFNVSPRLSS